MKTKGTGSIWWCETCGVGVWVCHAPKRLRHSACRHWMRRTDERSHDG